MSGRSHDFGWSEDLRPYPIGIGSIATTEATAALVKICQRSKGSYAVAAANVLASRMPFYAAPIFGGPGRKTNAALAARTWDDRFSGEILALAHEWLASDDPAHVRAGANFVRAVGSAADAPVSFAALSRSIAPLTTAREIPNGGNYPDPVDVLLGAFYGLRNRGFTFDEGALETPGAVLAYFDSYRAKPLPRSPKWRILCETYARSDNVLLREAAIRSIPSPVPSDCVEMIKTARLDPDANVRRAVLFVAGGKMIVN